MCAAAVLGVPDSVIDCIRLAVPQAPEWQRIGNQIDATMIFARADFINVFELTHVRGLRGNQFHDHYGDNSSERCLE